MKRPSLIWYFLELPRAILERIAFLFFTKRFKPQKRGKGQPILVIPGFMSSDLSTRPLRQFLNKMGYCAMDWGLGMNYGKVENLDILEEKLEGIYKAHQKKVTLIGWSLGGVYARELAKKHPDQIRNLITLASPFNGINQPNNAAWLFHLINKDPNPKILDPVWLENLKTPAPVATTAIYSKKDGIVPWEACLETIADELHENVEVKGSHCGLGVNKEVLKIIVERI